MEMLDRTISRLWLHFSTYHLFPRGRKNILILQLFAFAEDRNQTQAACTASKCAIHYTIASWLRLLVIVIENKDSTVP